MSVEDKTVFVVGPPPALDTQFLALVSRGGGFMGGGSQSVFAIDNLEPLVSGDGKVVAYRGVKNDGSVVCQFPYDTSYLLVTKDLITVTSPLESAKREKEEHDALRKVYDTKDEASEEATVDPKTGQYL